MSRMGQVFENPVMGRQPTYPEYLESDVVVAPDPAALGLLDESGRLRSEAPVA